MIMTLNASLPQSGDEASARALLVKLRTCSPEELDQLANEFFGFCDLSFHLLQLIIKEATPDSEWAECLDRLLDVVERLLPPKMLKEEPRYQGSAEAAGHLQSRMVPRRQLALLTRAWMRLLSFSLPTSLLTRCLLRLGDSEIARLRNPQLLADIAMNALDESGEVPLASLRAVFHLMLEHNVEYPNIYDRIFDLLGQPNLLRSPLRARFFKDLDVFLSSLHIPSRTVCNFAKRLAQLALRAEAPDCRLLLLLLSNLLRRQPPAQQLLHREAGEAAAAGGSLHELRPLAAHWDPEIAAAATTLMEKPPEVRVMEKDPEKESSKLQENHRQRISSATSLLRSLRSSNARLSEEAAAAAKRPRMAVPEFR